MSYMIYIVGGLIVVAIAAGAVFSYLRNQKINQSGVETDAVVSRIKETETEDSDGNSTVEYVHYVQYKNAQGQTVEAKLGNPPRFIREGDHLRVKYLAEKPKYVLMVKK